MKKIHAQWHLKQVISVRATDIIKFPDPGFSPDLPCDSSLKVTFLRDEEIAELMEFHDARCTGKTPVFSHAEVSSRLKTGHLCSLARIEDRLAGFCWFKTGDIHSPDLHCLFEFTEKSAVIHNAFVDPEYRGKNLTPMMMRESFRLLAGMGYKSVYAYIHSNNRSPMRTAEKFNRVPVGKIFFGYVLGCYFLLPLIQKDAGVRVSLDVSPWHRWQVFFNKRLSGIGVRQ